MRYVRLKYTVLMLKLLCLGGVLNAAPVQREHIEVELLSEVTQVVAGKPFWVALRLLPEPHWHTYWRNPGDSGLETRIEWRLPVGATAGEIQWPYPQRVDMAGIVNYGYAGETLLLTQITPPATPAQDVFELRAEAAWLVCEEICIPGDAELQLRLPYAPQVQLDAVNAPRFAQTRVRWPQPLNTRQAYFAVHGDHLQLALQGASALSEVPGKLEFFPMDTEVVDNAEISEMRWDEDTLYLRQQLSAYYTQVPTHFSGILVDHSLQPAQAYHFSAAAGVVDFPAAKVDGGFVLMMLFAFLGGVILNLMPCVFPVLSLKALSVIENAHLERAAQRWHGLAYGAGVILSFLLIAALLLLLRQSGEAIGWGFQLQQAWFVALLAFLLFVMALSLSGVVEFGASFMNTGEALTRRPGYTSSFFTGLLATVVATPCTAPFMGPAIGFALLQSVPAALMFFAALGLGLAAPFLLLAFLPVAGRYLPRPGDWMLVFKQAMAFPLYATVIWLLWVLGRQTDMNTLALVLCGLLLLGLAAWLWRLRLIVSIRFIPTMLMLLCLLSSAGILLSLTPIRLRSVESALTGQPYQSDALQQLRVAGRPVFVNLTADWCITCKVNERLVLQDQRLATAFEAHDIAYMVGDWTQRDAAITELLTTFSRSGVPLYIVYPADGGEPRLLPQILTVSTILTAFDIEELRQ